MPHSGDAANASELAVGAGMSSVAVPGAIGLPWDERGDLEDLSCSHNRPDNCHAGECMLCEKASFQKKMKESEIPRQNAMHLLILDDFHKQPHGLHRAELPQLTPARPFGTLHHVPCPGLWVPALMQSSKMSLIVIHFRASLPNCQICSHEIVSPPCSLVFGSRSWDFHRLHRPA